ncbi:MAG TPA: alpha/beta fold hydrolase [Verrucomicrobiae bacterium]|nr:alpha/beta fold hydrolase [Verrucomicrobiae bacterium]
METPVVFECKGQQIVGMLHLPEGRGRFPAALLLHGFTGTKVEAHRMYVKLSRALAEHGIASLRFDYRGSGDSAGNFEDMTIRSELADALSAIKLLAHHRRVNSRRLALIGLSMGGAVASQVAARERARVKSLVLWAPVAEGAGILDELSTPDAVSALAETGITDHEGNLVGVQFIRQFAEMKPLREITKCKCPVLIVHGSKDQTVPVHHADLYERALRSPRRIVKKVIITGADHTFNKHVWESRAISETVDWLSETM